MKAYFQRPSNINACVQNFAIFNYNGEVYMASGICKNSKDLYIHLSKYNFFTKTFCEIPITNTTYGTEVCLGESHADTIEVIDFNGKTYLLYTEGKFGSANKLCCRELTITNDTWLVGEAHYMTATPEYNSKPLYHTMVGISDNYICVTNSYGTNIQTDIEVYSIYDKVQFMTGLLSGLIAFDQDLFDYCIVATGCFAENEGLGLNVPFKKAVLQCIAIDETENNKVIILAPVDDRHISSEPDTVGRWTHQINRVVIDIKEMASEDAKTVQNLSSSSASYTPVDTLQFNSLSIGMNYDGGVYTNRFELEGLKKLTGFSGIGIPNGWYFTVNATPFKDTTFPSFVPKTATSVPWNSFGYLLDESKTYLF